MSAVSAVQPPQDAYGNTNSPQPKTNFKVESMHHSKQIPSYHWEENQFPPLTEEAADALNKAEKNSTNNLELEEAQIKLKEDLSKLKVENIHLKKRAKREEEARKHW